MDALITAAARALATGDALGALKHVALRDDAPALALRGIAMAQLGEYSQARTLLRRASRRFGSREAVARARCDVAAAEVALAMRDLGAPSRALETALVTLQRHADHNNVLQARLITARRLLLLGRLEEAATALALLDTRRLPPAIAAVAELTAAEIALRMLRVGAAREALAQARAAAERAGIHALQAEVAALAVALERPAARVCSGQHEHTLSLDEVATLLASGDLVIDACHRGVRAGAHWVALARRPVLFALVRALAAAWPGDIARTTLIALAFNTRRPDASHRARLRVELGRLRALLSAFACIDATAHGYKLEPRNARAVKALIPPFDGDQASLVALLADGTAWSTSALAQALGMSQRSVQRALVDLEAAGRARSIGQARARRWLSPPLTDFTTILLLPGAPIPA